MVRLQDEIEEASPNLKKLFSSTIDSSLDDPDTTLFTRVEVKNDGRKDVVKRNDRPALVISSTSFTPDEDFSILLEALIQLNSQIDEESKKREKQQQNGDAPTPTFSHILVVVTGKGPLKNFYKQKIDGLSNDLKHVSILTMWLEASDYPLLVGCADLGISLHVSTSGLDLPMKVLDFFGSEVPVCAIGFSCLEELVKDGVNGRVFETSDELSDQLFDLLQTSTTTAARENSNHTKNDLESMRKKIQNMERWNENWDRNAQPVLLKACHIGINGKTFDGLNKLD